MLRGGACFENSALVEKHHLLPQFIKLYIYKNTALCKGTDLFTIVKLKNLLHITK